MILEYIIEKVIKKINKLYMMGQFSSSLTRLHPHIYKNSVGLYSFQLFKEVYTCKMYES